MQAPEVPVEPGEHAVLVPHLDPVGELGLPEVLPGPPHARRNLGRGVQVEHPLRDRRHPGLAAQPLDLAHDVLVREAVRADVDLAHDADHRTVPLPDAEGGECVIGLPELGQHVAAPFERGRDPPERLAVDAVRLALPPLVGPVLPERLLEHIHRQDAPPAQPQEVLAHHPRVAVEGLVLHGRDDGHLLQPQPVQHQAVVPVVLAEAAGPLARGHEEGAPGRVEPRPSRRLDHVARRERQRVALPAGAVLLADARGLVVGLGQHLGVHAAGAEGRGDGMGMVRHGRQEDGPPPAGRGRADREGPPAPRFAGVPETVEEGLDPRDRARVGAVLVDLELQEGLASRLLEEEVGDEGIRSAAEVGEVDRVQAGMVPDEPGRGQDLLARPPVHLPEVRVVRVAQRQEVEGKGLHAEVADLGGQVHVQQVVAGIVAPAHHHEAGPVRRDPGKRPAAELLHRRLGALLRLPRHAGRAGRGPRPLAERPAHRPDAGEEITLILQPEVRFEHPDALKGKGRAGKIGQGLGVGACLAVVPPAMDRREPHKAREEEKVHLPVDQVEQVAQRDLRREAGLCRRALQPAVHDLPVRPLRQDGAEPELAEEGLPEGQLVGQVERARQPDHRPLGLPRRAGRLADQPLALGEKVRQPVLLRPLPDIVLLAPAAVEERLLAVEDHAPDVAAVGALGALEGRDLVGPLREIEPLESARPAVLAAERQDGRADGAGHLVMGRDRHGLSRHLLEGRDHGPVGGHAALEEDAAPDLPARHDLVQVVLGDGVGQTCRQVRHAGAGVQVVHQVGLHEDRAALAEPAGAAGAERPARELLLDPDAEPLRLLLQEGAGARGAGLVHLEVHHRAVTQADVFRVLPADLEDRVHRRVDGRGSRGLGGDLVPHQVGADHVAREIPARARGGRAHDAHPAADLGAHLGQALLHRLDRPARGGQVALGEHAHLPVDHHHVRRDRSHVHAEIGLDQAVAGRGRILVRVRHDARGIRQRQPSFIGGNARGVLDRREAGRSAVGRRRLAPAPQGEGGAHGARGVEMLRHGQVGLAELQDLPEGPAHAEVRRDAAEEEDRRVEGPALADRGLEVPGHGEAEPGDDVMVRRGDLLEMDHVALGEDAASPRHGRGRPGAKRDLAELLDGEMEAVGLLVQEGAGAGCAGGVHGEVLDPDAAARFGREGDELGVLAAHLDDRPAVGMERAGEGGLGEDLVDEERAERLGRGLAAAARDARSNDAALGEPLMQAGELLPERPDRIALDAAVGVGQQLALLVQHGGLDAHGSDIDPETEVVLHGNGLLGTVWHERLGGTRYYYSKTGRDSQSAAVVFSCRPPAAALQLRPQRPS